MVCYKVHARTCLKPHGLKLWPRTGYVQVRFNKKYSTYLTYFDPDQRPKNIDARVKQ
jgi:hypothetical protein